MNDLRARDEFPHGTPTTTTRGRLSRGFSRPQLVAGAPLDGQTNIRSRYHVFCTRVSL